MALAAATAAAGGDNLLNGAVLHCRSTHELNIDNKPPVEMIIATNSTQGTRASAKSDKCTCITNTH